MAESERKCSEDEEGDDEFFKDVEEFIAASNSKQQETTTFATVRKSTKEDGGKNATCTVEPGFHDTDVVVVEGKTRKKAVLGTGILLQDPATWGKIDKRMRCSTKLPINGWNLIFKA